MSDRLLATIRLDIVFVAELRLRILHRVATATSGHLSDLLNDLMRVVALVMIPTRILDATAPPFHLARRPNLVIDRNQWAALQMRAHTLIEWVRSPQ